MADKNFQIAKFYSKLYELKDMLNNDLIPLGVHIAVLLADAKLFESIEVLAADIDEHLKTYEITIGAKK
jgi:hypothetical protein